MILTEALDAYGIRWKNSQRANNIWICCPYCIERGETQDTRYRLGVDVAKGDAHCFNCKWRVRKLAILQLRQKLALGDWVTTGAMTQQREKKPIKLPKDFEVLSDEDREYWGKRIYRYVRQRGVSDSQIRRWKIGYSVTGNYACRVVIPVYYERRLAGLVTRAVKESQKPKFKNSVGDKALFGIPKQPKDSCVLVESVFDALAVNRAVGSKFDGLGILGHSITGRQLDMLRRHYKTFVLWPDPDAPGIEGFIEVGNMLNAYGQVKIIMPVQDDDRDPDELPLKVRRERVLAARPWTETSEARLKLFLTYIQGE